MISNDKVWFSNKKFTSNNDLNNIITCLNENYEINLVCRKSKKKLNFSLDDNFNHCRFDKINEKKINIFVVSITPYNINDVCNGISLCFFNIFFNSTFEKATFI